MITLRKTVAQQDQYNENNLENNSQENEYDFTYVSTTARVAVYDDVKIAPRVFEIEPAPTAEFIEKLADTIDEQKRRLGGGIPYSAIREVTENFIHAKFTEPVVSILDGGNTIRFCDQGPGIPDKEKVTLPGFTSAIEPMKEYIRGVGSGLPLVKEYLEFSHGKITIEDNIHSGAVVTLSIEENPSPNPVFSHLTPSQGVRGNVNPYPQSSQNPYVHQITSGYREPQQYLPQSNWENQMTHSQIPSGSVNVAAQGWTNSSFQQPQTQWGVYTPSQLIGSLPIPPLSDRERDALVVFAHEGALRVTDLSELLGLAMSSAYTLMGKLEQSNLIQKDPSNSKIRILTEYGSAVAQALSM